MSLIKPPALGFPIPSARHAVSVQLPKWKDMCGLVAQEPRVIKVQQIGYPRSFLNQDVVKVHDACLAVFGQSGEQCLVFPALNHAMDCKNLIIQLAPEVTDHVRVQAADFVLDRSSLTARKSRGPAGARRYYIVFFPERVISSAMVFWRLTGTGISSRLAESMHERLGSLCSAPVIDKSDTSMVLRELIDAQANNVIRTRISDLLKRGSISPQQSSRTSPSDVFLYPTGMTAIFACNKLLQSWRPDQSVVFGFPYELTLKLLQTYGKSCKFYGLGTTKELDELETYLITEQQAGRKVQSVWCECASNPLLRTVDLTRIRNLADEFGFVVVVDETIGSFANVDLINVADILITSLTKSFSGNADVMAGSIVLNPESPFYVDLKQSLGSVYINELFRADAVVLEYNSRAFLPRAEKMNRNASHLVSTLLAYTGKSSSTLTHIYHPSTCWSRKNYEATMREPTPEFTPGYGGLFSLEFESVMAASTFFDALNVHKGPSLGALVTLAQPYVQTVFSKEKEWAASFGLSETIVRISVGLEDEELLARDFERALRLADRFKMGRQSHGHLESFL